MADANTMIRCIIGDDAAKVEELQQIRREQKIIYTIYSYDKKLQNAIKRFGD